MHYQCAPDPEDVLASRRLSDGRTLAVFRNRVCEQEVVRRGRAQRVIAGEVIVSLAYEACSMRTRWSVAGYSLVVTDDTELPEKWRTLCAGDAVRVIVRAFESFQEGDDDRRSCKSGDHPYRRVTDISPGLMRSIL